jgi:CPA1 family monovalent cation:H+ antiporter
VVLTALFSYLNVRRIHLPTTIALMIMALALSMVLILLARFTPLAGPIEEAAKRLVGQIHFSRVLLRGLLGFLLFAGALSVDLEGLLTMRWPIGVLATGGVIASTFIVGTLSWLVLSYFRLGLPFVFALVFGALISPTDPIAVLHIFRQAGAPRKLEATVAGESLFNDGVGVVIFGVLLSIAATGRTSETAIGLKALLMFGREAGGGVAMGFGVGYIVYLMLKRIDHYQTEILLTLALVLGGYTLGEILKVSGPLAMVAAGILIGNRGRAKAMSQKTRQNLDTFWELVDDFFNGILFVFIGLEALVLTFEPGALLAGLALIPIVLLARLLSAGIPIGLLNRRYSFSRSAWSIVTWAGLRGGLAVAMALSIPPGSERTLIVSVTYVIVVVSVIVQGLTMPLLIRVALGR